MSQSIFGTSIEDRIEVRSTTQEPKRVLPVVGVHHNDIASLLARMTFAERVRAYRSGAFSRCELSAAAAREPDRMPTLNNEFEWIAISLADLD